MRARKMLMKNPNPRLKYVLAATHIPPRTTRWASGPSVSAEDVRAEVGLLVESLIVGRIFGLWGEMIVGEQKL
jgi:hypothetical protein